MTAPGPADIDRAAAAALSVPGVTGLHGGEFGTVATYLPGRRVTGIRVDDGHCAVHVTVRYPIDLFATAQRIRTAVHPIVAVPVDVTIEDVTTENLEKESRP
ncbi:hypothetical protein [Prescottella subtropica]|uniref:hypothetical protein n=1 Tax=Prescottella subtropica TaxID=2545757 RepID=UPI0010F4CAAD|nr:hypothetical protein [Prescottella subtropica]